MSALLQCYNKGCGKKFDLENNPEDACRHHPGSAVFHDALKGWSCCDRRSTDFTEFLNIPGCAISAHSNVKPPEPDKPVVDPSTRDEVIVVEAPKMRDPFPSQMERPALDEPMKPLKRTVAASLKKALEDLQIRDKCQATDNGPGGAIEVVKVGTSCRNKPCKATYEGETSDGKKCVYHPGVPIFHEGLKFWSCCKKRTTDFASFLAQEGCQEGKHRWHQTAEEACAEKACRFDWHQTPSTVCLSFFIKASVPEETVIEVNQVACHVKIVFEGGKSCYENFIILREPIVPEKSDVKLLGTKVEVNLHKAEPYQWPSLSLPEKPPVAASPEKSKPLP